MKKITISDVARHAGVSPGSVSRVLTGKNWVSDDVRRRVAEAVEALNFVPNSMARSLKSQRTMAIGAMVSNMSIPMHSEFLAAVEEHLQGHGYLLLVANTRNKPERERELLNVFSSGRADGIIISHADESDQRTLLALKETRLPIVFNDRSPNDLGDTVIADHRAGVYEATKYLLSLGHRRIALIMPPTTVRPGRERLVGYRTALSEAGVSPDDRLVGILEPSSPLTYSHCKELLSRTPRPTALICLGSRMLAGSLSAIASCGLAIPDDLSLIGAGDSDLIRHTTPPITAVKYDVSLCGRWAAEMMIDRLTGRKPVGSDFRTVEIPTELTLRYSCAPPARS